MSVGDDRRAEPARKPRSTLLDTPTPPNPGLTPRARTAWRAVASVAAALLLVFGVVQTLSVLSHGERTFTRSFPTDVVVVDIQVSSGSVEVVAADVDEITVTATVSDGFRATGADQEIVDDRLVLTGTCPLYLSDFCAVHYDVEVPADVAVTARVDDGPIRIVGVSGPVDVSSDNSGMEIVGVSGPLTIHSDNGSLRGENLRSASVEASTDNGPVELAFATAPEMVIATSDNGSVEVRLPEVAGDYRVETDADNGSTEVDVATDPASGRLVVLGSDNGDLRVLGSGTTER